MMENDFRGYLGTYRPYQDFPRYLARFERLMLYNRICDDAIKLSYLVSVAGADVCALINTLSTTDRRYANTYDVITALMRRHLRRRPNPFVQREKFYRRNQTTAETATEYVMALRELAASCDFGGYDEAALLDRVLAGAHNEEVREELLAEPVLTVERAAEVTTQRRAERDCLTYGAATYLHMASGPITCAAEVHGEPGVAPSRPPPAVANGAQSNTCEKESPPPPLPPRRPTHAIQSNVNEITPFDEPPTAAMMHSFAQELAIFDDQMERPTPTADLMQAIVHELHASEHLIARRGHSERFAATVDKDDGHYEQIYCEMNFERQRDERNQRRFDDTVVAARELEHSERGARVRQRLREARNWFCFMCHKYGHLARSCGKGARPEAAAEVLRPEPIEVYEPGL